MKNLFKTFQPFINKCKKSNLPVLGEVRVQNGEALISNLETWVTFKTDLPDGMYNIINGEAFKGGCDPNDFPTYPSEDFPIKATIKALSIVEHALCTGDDPLRPAFSGIHINKEHMVATDAHVLKYTPTHLIGEVSDDINIIFEPVAPLLARIKNDPVESIKLEVSERWCRFIFSDCTITQRLVEGNFPSYKFVIPDWKKLEMQCFKIENATVSEMVKFEKAADRTLMVVHETQMVISNLDLQLTKTWQAPENVPFPEREPDALLMPMEISDEPGSRVGFRPSHLQRIVGTYKGTVTIGFYDKTRAMAIWVNKDAENTRTKRTRNEGLSDEKPQESQMPAVKNPMPESRDFPKYNLPAEPVHDGNENGSILILPYSDKAIAVFGAPKEYRDAFMECWGRYNRYLKHPKTGEITSGWIFSKKRTEQIKEIVSKAS